MNQPDDVISEIDQNVSFTILVKKTHIPVKFDVYKNEKIINIDSLKTFVQLNENEYSFTFALNNTVKEDSGQYNFIVSNIYGKSSVSARLLIKCR